MKSSFPSQLMAGLLSGPSEKALNVQVSHKATVVTLNNP